MTQRNSATATDTSPLTPPPAILVVDDEQQMCDVCARTLRRNGYHVVTTSNPTQAVRLLNAQRFDVLLTDIKMPGMSGLELARIAHEQDPATAIIIMTGFASFETMQQSVQRGITDFLSKPFELDQLRLAVTQALNKRALLRDNLRLSALEQLLQSSRKLNTTLELNELAAMIMREALQHSGVDGGFLVLLGEDGGLETLAASHDGAYLTDDGKHLIEQCVGGDNVTVPAVPVAHIADRPYFHAQCLPIDARGATIGALMLCAPQPVELRAGAQEEVLLLVHYAGATLHNAALFRQLNDAYQRLQELDRLKSEFISIASHELRTPLSIVLGYTTMLCDQTEGQQREYARRVFDGGQRIKAIVDDMVNLRYLETGETSVQTEPVVLQDVITGGLQHHMSQLESQQHTLTVELPEQPLRFWGDREKIGVVLGHLLTNAIKFTRTGGHIIVRAYLRPAGVATDREGRPVQTVVGTGNATGVPWVVFEVQDTGIGLAAHEQQRIFERFYQVGDSLRRNAGGTGLGLAIVRELITTLGGAIWITSSEGMGSIFTVALPYRQSK